MTDEPEINPYAAPGAAPSKPTNLWPTDDRPRKSWLRRAWIVQLLIIFAALGLEAIDVKTIVGTGPAYLVAGLFTSISAYRQRNLAGALVGWSAVALTVLILFLINFLGWGPSDADFPVSVIIWSYAVIAVSTLLYLLFRNDSDLFRNETNTQS